jgi:hypothetical protein
LRFPSDGPGAIARRLNDLYPGLPAVYLIVDAKRIRPAPADLPLAATPDGKYERILGEISNTNKEFSHCMFQFVAVASRPRRVKELAEWFEFEFRAGPIPKFREDWRPEGPVNTLLSACLTLLAIIDSGYPYGNVMKSSHSFGRGIINVRSPF